MQWILFSDDKLLLTAEGTLPCGPEQPTGTDAASHVFSFEASDGESCRAMRTGKYDERDFTPIGLRQSYDYLSEAGFKACCKAAELLHWDAHTKFCGACGAELKYDTEISKRCPECNREWWPQLSPAVIVAISRDDKLLMVQSKTFRSDYMGLVAGFVETGESLEECVRREVREETSIEIQNLRYFGSQTWPFPAGIMLGFTADYASGEIQLQQSELRKGGWYDADNMPRVPRRMSIARRLIEDWLIKQGREDVIETLDD